MRCVAKASSSVYAKVAVPPVALGSVTVAIDQMTDVKLFPTPEYTTRQSAFVHLPKVPIRGALVGGSGSGKTRALVSMLLRQYRGCFSRIFVFSPSVNIDMMWLPVKNYVEHTLKVDTDKEPAFFEEWEPARLEKRS